MILYIWTTATSEGGMYGPTVHIAKDYRYPEECVRSGRIDSFKCVCEVNVDIDNFDPDAPLDDKLVSLYGAFIDMGIYVCWCDRA